MTDINADLVNENRALREEAARLKARLAEASEREAATSEILQVISRSPTDMQPVFDKIALNAVRLCNAAFCALFREERGLVHLVAHYNFTPEGLAEIQRLFPMPLKAPQTAARLIASGEALHVADVLTDQRIPPGQRRVAEIQGYRGYLGVPMLGEGKAIGAIAVARREVGLFSESQIALLKTFADQAVIAIENVRLFTELQQKNEALTQAHAQVSGALDRQTATSEILRVISRSPTDVQPVFDTIVRNAVQLCDAIYGTLNRLDGDLIHLVAHYGLTPDHVEQLMRGFPRSLTNQGVTATAIRAGMVVRVSDLEAESDAVPPEVWASMRARGVRSVLVVPMLRQNQVIGSINVTHRGVGAFTETHVQVLKTFTDQAVIAIENVRLFKELEARNHDLTEALEQQTATAEILRAISSSPTDIQPVFAAVLASAARLCDAVDATIFQVDGDSLRLVAHEGPIPSQPVGALRALTPGTPSTRAVLEVRTIHVVDLQAEADEYPEGSALARSLDFRTVLNVPMIRGAAAIGVIGIRRTEARPFTEGQTELLKTFADQAVIAIENVRLFKELEARNRDLSEALDRQTATADVLRIIAQSPTELQPVLNAIASSAVRLCAASDAVIERLEGERFYNAAHAGVQMKGLVGLPLPLTRHFPGGRAILDRRPIIIDDIQVVAASEYPDTLELLKLNTIHSVAEMPLLSEGKPLGSLAVLRSDVRPFTDAEVALLQTFADQAVIAIENVRLFKELELRNRDLTTALEQQTAAGEILRVISSSPTDEKPVFDAIARSSVRLCAAAFAVVASFDGELLYFVAGEHVDTEGRQALAEVYPMRPDRGQLAGRAILDRMVIHVTDVTLDPEYVGASLGNRATLSVPMLRTGAPIGTITIARFEPVPFTDQQIELLKTFADQAVIAIENVRLFTELEARNHDLTRALDRETATSEILRVISSSPTDVQPVFDAIVRSAVTLCGAILGAIYRRDGGLVRLVGLDPRYPHAEEVRAAYPAPVTSTLMSCRAIHENAIIQLPDTETSGVLPPEGLRLARLSGFRSVVAVPMRREGEPIGAILVGRPAVGAFPDEQIGLLQAFADQAVIAIENVRLFNETKEALEQQTATSEILGVISRSPTDTHPVFEAIAANAARLCSANDAQVFRVEGEVLRLAAAFGAPSMPAVRQLTRGHLVGRAVIDRKTIHVRDLAQALAEYPETTAARYGVQSALAVPLLREKVALGVIRISRTEIQPFTDKQITLLQTFADQAVIAIENVRLFKELQTRTQELSRSVDQLTALGEVGRAVSSTLDLETVLTTIVTRVVQITGLDGGVVSEYDEAAEEFVQRATSVTGGVLVRALRGVRYRRGEGVLGRTAITREPVQVPDITVPGAYDSPVRQNLIESGIRAVLAVPMLHQERLIGSLGVTRNQPGEFSSETIDLLRTFATQSALAIQNARLFREIEEKSHQLEVASQHKSEFLANMSHELRTPLNAIIGFSEVLTDRMFGELNEKQEEYLKDIYASGTHLLSLINDILDLSKIEAGRMELELSDFHLPTALDNALTLVRERAGRRSIMLQTSVDERLGQIRADERKIRQVVLNLLSNAIKFTPESGRIEVAAVPRDGSVEVSVSDTGVGIAQEDQEAVFEEFRQVGTADKKAEGTGLGLTLCRKFIELHGGRIWVKSQVGVGSTFTFTIPVRRGE